MNKILVRNAPSPTGLFHVGTARTGLFNFLFAKKHQGKFILRFEDTDTERSQDAFIKNILEGHLKLGLQFDEEPTFQSQRKKIYKKYLHKILEEKKAFYCFCTKKEMQKKREEQIKKKLPPRHECQCHLLENKICLEKIKTQKYCIRFLLPQDRGDIIINDLVRGEIKINVKQLDNFVIAKDLETPIFNFCNVVDDYEMNITHVLRGEDHIPNTPKHILLYEALGFPIPQFGHFPLILNTDKSKLSKRKNKVSIDDYLNEGYLPEAIINFLALLGWNDGTEQEIFSLEKLINKFSLERVHKGGAVFDLKKLDWLNSKYIKQLNNKELLLKLDNFIKKTKIQPLIAKKGTDYLEKVIKAVQEKMKKLSEIEELITFFYDFSEPSKEIFLHEKMKVDENIAKTALEKSIDLITNIASEEFTEENLKEKCLVIIKNLNWKNGQLLWPLRAGLTGKSTSPGAFEVACILRKEECLIRLKKCLSLFT